MSGKQNKKIRRYIRESVKARVDSDYTILKSEVCKMRFLDRLKVCIKILFREWK